MVHAQQWKKEGIDSGVCELYSGFEGAGETSSVCSGTHGSGWWFGAGWSWWPGELESGDVCEQELIRCEYEAN